MPGEIDGKKAPYLEGQQVDLFVESYSNSARTLQIRGLTKTEQIIGDHKTNADRSKATSIIRLTEIPELLSVQALETGVKRGECYVKISLRINQVVAAILCAGYVTDAGSPNWPNGKIESSTEGPGLIRSITGTNPAAGVEISETVPPGAVWKPISLIATFVTSADVANRLPSIVLDDGTNIYFTQEVTGLQTASSTVLHEIAVGLERLAVVSTNKQLGIPIGTKMAAGNRIRTLTANIVAADNWGVPQLLVEEWIQP